MLRVWSSAMHGSGVARERERERKREWERECECECEWARGVAAWWRYLQLPGELRLLEAPSSGRLVAALGELSVAGERLAAAVAVAPRHA